MPIMMISFFKSLKRAFSDTSFRVLLSLVLLVLLTGTIFYNRVEGWSYFDSFYFSVITLTTVGYGDMSPTTFSSKLFTIFYLFIGIGLIVSFITTLASNYIEYTKEKHKIRKEKRK